MNWRDLTYGERILILRHRRGYSQRALAKMTGTKAAVLSKMEHGFKNPAPEILENISMVFNVSVNDLLLGFDDPNKNQPISGLIKA